jgi:glutathione-regulated potassium-efflux system protein KefB
MVGFGRFGQIASQILLSNGIKLAVIDREPDRIRDAKRYGFQVFFGDGNNLATLHHSGAGQVDAIIVCINDRDAATQIVGLVQSQFPQARLLVRSYDREHSVELIRSGVEYQIRETVESAYVMGTQTLRLLGFSEIDIVDADHDIRMRDAERLSQQVYGNDMSGVEKLILHPRTLFTQSDVKTSL